MSLCGTAYITWKQCNIKQLQVFNEVYIHNEIVQGTVTEASWFSPTQAQSWPVCSLAGLYQAASRAQYSTRTVRLEIKMAGENDMLKRRAMWQSTLVRSLNADCSWNQGPLGGRECLCYSGMMGVFELGILSCVCVWVVCVSVCVSVQTHRELEECTPV